MMLTADELDAARADLEAELVDRILVRRHTGWTFDETTLENVPTYDTIIADPGEGEANALVVPETQSLRTVDQAGEPVILRMYMVTLPYSGTEVQLEDEVVVVASADGVTDDVVLTVRDVRHGTLSISRRLSCQQGPPVTLSEGG